MLIPKIDNKIVGNVIKSHCQFSGLSPDPHLKGNWQETSEFLAGRGGTSAQGCCCSPLAVDRERVDYKG